MLSRVRFLVPLKTRTDCKVMEEKPSLSVCVLKRFLCCATGYWALWLLPTREIIVRHCQECVLELFLKTKFAIFKEWNTPLKCAVGGHWPILTYEIIVSLMLWSCQCTFHFFFETKIWKYKWENNLKRFHGMRSWIVGSAMKPPQLWNNEFNAEKFTCFLNS